MKIYAYLLKCTILEIETVVKIKFEKSLEKTFIAKKSNNQFVFYSMFNSIAFVGYTIEEVSAYIKMLGINKESLQDFDIEIDDSLKMQFAVKGNKLFLKTNSVELISIAALVVMQSVGLDFYEAKLDSGLEDSKAFLSDKTTRLFKSKKLVEFVSSSAILRHELISDLRMLDKPLIVWDDDDYDALYDKLSKFFELKERFDIVEYKITLLRDDLVFLLDTEQHKKSVFLEWIIIIIIGFELLIGILKY